MSRTSDNMNDIEISKQLEKDTASPTKNDHVPASAVIAELDDKSTENEAAATEVFGSTETLLEPLKPGFKSSFARRYSFNSYVLT